MGAISSPGGSGSICHICYSLALGAEGPRRTTATMSQCGCTHSGAPREQEGRPVWIQGLVSRGNLLVLTATGIERPGSLLPEAKEAIST